MGMRGRIGRRCSWGEVSVLCTERGSATDENQLITFVLFCRQRTIRDRTLVRLLGVFELQHWSNTTCESQTGKPLWINWFKRINCT